MHIDVVTIFPELFEPFLATSLVGRAVEHGVLEVTAHDLRNYTTDRHRVVDDEPYGGGAGMVMKAEPWLRAVRSLEAEERAWRVLLTPRGERLDETLVRRLAERPRLLLLCGRYEGVDQRVHELVVDQEISIGDYVLSGGELAAMVVIEAVSRQIPGVVGRPESVERDSFRSGLLDHPHYTRPATVEAHEVPEVLLSGDHAAIERWRRKQSLRLTRERRPELLAAADLTPADRTLLVEIEDEDAGGGGDGSGDAEA